MKKQTLAKKLTLNTEKIANLTDDQLAQAVGGIVLTRPYTKVSVCTGTGPCLTEFCYPP